MKAFYAKAYGGPEVMELGELPDPKPTKGQVLVRIQASSVNPVDWKVRSGQLKIASGKRFPKPLGTDFAGTVEELGAGVDGFEVGQRVYGLTPIMFGKPGAHGELLVVAGKQLRALPGDMPFETAASLPVAALAALSGLRKCGSLAGKQVLINGASGGVGHFAVQIACKMGAEVHGVCSEANGARVRELGATQVIDYKAEDFTQGAQKYDVVFDAHGHLKFSDGARAMKRRGHFISTLPMPPLMIRALWQNVFSRKRIVFGNVRSKPEDFATLESLLQSGVAPIISHTMSLEKAAQAFALLERGGTVGKIVLSVP